MTKTSKQMQEWAAQFGKEYSDRNAVTLEEMESLYKKQYGLTRTEMNSRFVADFDKDVKILEVGSNIGNQLLCLQKAGFQNLYGIELQSYAVELSKGRTKDINIIQGSAFDIPFRDDYFDLVFTSGLLIHISPGDIATALDEIYRCTNKYIWCFEYFAAEYTRVKYRGHDNLLWKTNFSKLFLDRFDGLELIREEFFKYVDNDNVDVMFLLRKKK
ncbi:pseudaminic acid biosynthesis-associated methylase [Chloroflexota bacterium]